MLKLPRAIDEVVSLSDEVWDCAATEIERSANLQVSPPLELTDGPSGRRLAIRNLPDRLYWGVVQCNGPQGTEPDYPDNRYWVALGFVSNVQTDDPTAMVKVTAYPPGDPRRKVVTANNFFESNDATHFVRPQKVLSVGGPKIAINCIGDRLVSCEFCSTEALGIASWSSTSENVYALWRQVCLNVFHC